MSTVVYRVRNDSRLALSGTLKVRQPGANELTPIDLTGASIRLIAKLGGVVKIDGLGDVVSGPNGIFSYNWADNDLDTAGILEAEIEITFGDGKKLTLPSKEPFQIRVRADLA